MARLLSYLCFQENVENLDDLDDENLGSLYMFLFLLCFYCCCCIGSNFLAAAAASTSSSKNGVPKILVLKGVK